MRQILKPLTIVQSNALQHVAALEAVVQKHAEAAGPFQLEANWDLDLVAVNLVGAGCEFIRRNRGSGRTAVVPLMQIDPNLWAWLGLQEQWQAGRRVVGNATFAFRSLSATVHFGLKAELEKPQVFRAEWAGATPHSNGEVLFQGKNAGHPHWQIDVLESLAKEAQDEETQDLLELLRAEIEPPTEAMEFLPVEPTINVQDLVRTQKLSRLHFASAAPWWMPPPQNAHAHNPARAEQAVIWLDRTLGYMKEQLMLLRTGI